jgi:hypothetical protein
VETYSSEIHVCMCLWENRGTKRIPKLELGISKVFGCDFSHPYDGPQNSHLFLSGPYETAFDKPDLECSDVLC